MPAFVWDGKNDAQGIGAQTALEGQWGTNGTFLAAAGRNFTNKDANLQAQIPQIQHQGELSLDHSINNAAKRHMLHSGNNAFHQTEDKLHTSDSLDQNSRDQQANTDDLANARGTASSNLATGTTQIATDSQARLGAAYTDNWRRTNGIV